LSAKAGLERIKGGKNIPENIKRLIKPAVTRSHQAGFGKKNSFQPERP